MTAHRTHDVLVVGESLGLLVAEAGGRLLSGAGMRLRFGGAESNVAIGVSRLGGSSAWAGRLGADAVGDLILRELRAEGVASFAARDAGVATALMLKERPHPGTSRVTYYRRGQAGSRLTAADVPMDEVARARILHVTGISAGLGTGPLTAVHAAIDAARAAGTLVSVDVNHRSALWEDMDAARTAYRGLVERADIVFAGDDEAEIVTGETDPHRQAAALVALGPSRAVVKLGDRGALTLGADGESLARDAWRVDVVDTVGAGDAFVAGWLSELAVGTTAERCLETATACGAVACTGEGDWEAAPTRADLEWLRRGPGDPVIR
jgi:2-dehydro-3-deoxygluconokinase